MAQATAAMRYGIGVTPAGILILAMSAPKIELSGSALTSCIDISGTRTPIATSGVIRGESAGGSNRLVGWCLC